MKRRWWVDGPRWKWLCRVLGHQEKWYHWAIWPSDHMAAAISGALGWSNEVTPSWHYSGLGCAEGDICGRCDEII